MPFALGARSRQQTPAIGRILRFDGSTSEQVHGEACRRAHSNAQKPTRLYPPVAHVEAIASIDNDRIGADGSRHEVTVDIMCRAVKRETPRDVMDSGTQRNRGHELGRHERIMLSIETTPTLPVIERIARMQRTYRHLDTTQRSRDRENHTTRRDLGIQAPANIASRHLDRLQSRAHTHEHFRLSRNKIETHHHSPPAGGAKNSLS